MHRTLLRDLEEPAALLVAQRTAEDQLPLDLIELAFLRLAVRAVGGMDARVAETDGDAVERPLLASRVQRDGYGRSGAERGQQVVVRAGAGVGAARIDRLVGNEPVPADEDLLLQARRAAVDGDRCHRALPAPRMRS